MHLKSDTDMIESCKNGNMEIMIAIWKDQIEKDFIEQSMNKKSLFSRIVGLMN